MKQFRESVGVSLILVLVIGQIVPAFGQQLAMLPKPGRNVVPGRPANKATGSKAPTSAVLSKIHASLSMLRPKGNARGQATVTDSGGSRTLLPDGRMLVIGGEGPNGPLSSAAIEDPRSNQSTPLPNGLIYSRAWHTATTLPDGAILILGGVGANGQLVDRAEVFDPQTQKFEVLSSSSLTPRAHHSATMLTDGRVMIAGGLSSNGKTINRVELWDFRTKTASRLTAKLRTARYGHEARLLADGDVLLSGGINDDGSSLNDGELYLTQSQRFIRRADISTQQVIDSVRVEASLPENGAVTVPIDAYVSLRFSKPLRVDTIGTGTLTLAGPQGAVPVRVVPAEAGMLAFVTPDQPLLPNAGYTLSISGLTDQSGIFLPVTSVSFTTGGTLSGAETTESERWIPDASNIEGKWETGRARSKWESLPPLEAPPGVTAVAGQALTLNGKPLASVTMKIGDATARTDDTGRFLIAEIASGHHELVIDGRSASTSRKKYGVFEAGIDVEAAKTNALTFTIWMPVIDTEHEVKIASPTKGETVITTPLIPGLEVRIPANTVIRDHEGKAVKKVSITPIPLDRPPFPLPKDVYVPIYFTVQPGGGYVHVYGQSEVKGARLIYPNYRREAAGTRFDFWQYDPMEKDWYVYGQGSVAADQKQIVPDAGVSVYEFTGAMVAVPSTAPSEGPICASDGDPVDLFTGLFVLTDTDLALPDTMPISLTRTYRTRDTILRAFGIGATHPYDMFLIGNTNPWTYIELILPDGGRIHYDRISGGTGFSDAVYEHTTTPTSFYKSRISWDATAIQWKLTLKDGMVLSFRAGDGATVARESGLMGVKDRYGNTVTVIRDSNSRATKIVSTNGRWIELSYDTSHRVTQATDNIGRTVSYTYDTSGRLWKVTNPMNGVTEYTYDTSHRMTSIKNPRGIVYVTNEYDANGRVSKQTHVDGGEYLFAYTLDGNGKVTQTNVTNPRGNVRRVTFNTSGYLLTDVHALGQSEEQAVTYERVTGTQQVSSKIDPLGRRTNYSYDSIGNVASITFPAGTTGAVTTSYTYEPNYNQVATITDPLNHTMTYDYDNQGNLIRETDSLGQQASYTYNSAGQIVSATDPLQNTTLFIYDQGDLVKVIDPLGRSSSQFVDSGGRIISEIDPLGQKVISEYDALDRLTQIEDPLNGVTSFTYDANGNLLTITDARGKVTTYSYDSMDRMLTFTDPLQLAVSFEYDLMGKVKKITDRRGKVTSYNYDGLERRTFIGFGTTTSGGTTTYESTITFAYDATECGCGGTSGRLSQAVDSVSGTVSFSYDDFDRLISETTPQGTVSYGYDTAGRRTSLTLAGQSVVNYVYDNADRLTQISQGTETVTLAYDAADRETAVTLPNGVSTEYGYDAASQLTSLSYRKNATALGNLTYEYDAAGQITKTGGSFAQTSLPASLSSTGYNSNNQLSTFNAQTFTYDDDGNLTSDGLNTYTWNARNQLIGISGTGLSASFQYDAFGRRASKTVNGVTTSYLYDAANVVQEQIGGAASANILSGGIDEIFRRTDATGTWSPIADGLGSVIGLTDVTGALQTQYTYEPFGKTTQSGAGNNNPSKYTGREDDGTGLNYYRARYYSPSLQRFISEDPLRFQAGMNFYAYVDNDPINYSDPFGLKRSLPQGAKTKCYPTDDCPTLGEKMANGARALTRRVRQFTKGRNAGRSDTKHMMMIANAAKNLNNCIDLFMKKCVQCGPPVPVPDKPPTPVAPPVPVPPPVPMPKSWWRRLPAPRLPVWPIFINPCIIMPELCKKQPMA